VPQFDQAAPTPGSRTIEISEPVAEAATTRGEVVQPPVAPEPAQAIDGQGTEASVHGGEPPAAQPEAPPPARTETVITQADPAHPKKGGWWQRARATLGGDKQ